jgi:hypothetical protein
LIDVRCCPRGKWLPVYLSASWKLTVVPLPQRALQEELRAEMGLDDDAMEEARIREERLAAKRAAKDRKE